MKGKNTTVEEDYLKIVFSNFSLDEYIKEFYL